MFNQAIPGRRFRGLLAGAVAIGAVAAAAPVATPLRHTQPSGIQLASGDASWQPAMDQLLDAMQQALAYDLGLTYASPGDADTLLTMLQNTNYELLMSGLSRVTELFNGVFFQSPEVVAGNAADSRQYFDFFTPDIYYRVTAGLAPGATYVLSGNLGGGTEHLSLSALEITAGAAETRASLELGHDLVVNPDGSFSVVIGPDQPWWAVNYLDSTEATTHGAASLLIRDMLGDWAQGPGNVSLRCLADCPPFFSIPEGGFFPGDGDGGADTLAGGSGIGSIDSMLTTLFGAFAQIVVPFNERSIAGGAAVGMAEPANTMFVLAPQTQYGAGLESAVVSGGNFELADGEALVIKMPDLDSAYSGIQLMNVYGGALPYTLAQTTLNNTQAFHSADGYTYYVVSATNPGVANWLDSSDVTRGEIFARFENLTDRADALGLPVQTYLVPVGEVADYLPDDTPTVSPGEYAADMAQRVLSYDYALDVSRMHAQPDWVTQHLLLDAFKGLMGADNFASVFGEEPITPLALRFTDALSPDWDAVWHSITTDPFGSLTAVANNLPLLWSDVSLPFQLAVGQSILALFFPQESLLNDVLFDPNSGILAGLLNARDDLATAILTATGGFPAELGAQAALDWANMAELVTSTPALSLDDLGSLFTVIFG